MIHRSSYRRVSANRLSPSSSPLRRCDSRLLLPPTPGFYGSPFGYSFSPSVRVRRTNVEEEETGRGTSRERILLGNHGSVIVASDLTAVNKRAPSERFSRENRASVDHVLCFVDVTENDPVSTPPYPLFVERREGG